MQYTPSFNHLPVGIEAEEEERIKPKSKTAQISGRLLSITKDTATVFGQWAIHLIKKTE